MHGISRSIVFDRDTKFVGHFWRTLWKKLDNHLIFILAYHPQMDGQIEVVNRSLGNMLRCLVGNTPSNWDMALTHTKFAYNDSPNNSTGLIPFYIIYGMHPSSVFELRDIGNFERRSADGRSFPKLFMTFITGQIAD